MGTYSTIILLPAGSTSTSAILQMGDGTDLRTKNTPGGISLMGTISSDLAKDDLRAEIIRQAPDTKQILIGTGL